jgi:23S rRNA (cytosine1962-C5)-methyltransferase
MPMRPADSASFPTIRVSRRGGERLALGHVWVYRSDLLSADGVPPGSVVTVADHRGKVLGTALYSSASQIAIRMLSSMLSNRPSSMGSSNATSHDPIPDFTALLRQRIAAAIAYREDLVTNTDAYRIVFSEADFLPGLIVDRYNDILSLQILTQAMDAEPVRSAILTELTARLRPASIIERVDPRVRELESLPPRDSGLLQGEKTSTTFTMNGIQFRYAALEGQKTGAFLDQRENYAAAAQYAHGEALDVFCYQGGFALHLAPRCSRVTGVDSSRPALEVADQNAVLNHALLGANKFGPSEVGSPEIEWIEANAFDLLKDYSSPARPQEARRYDTIVLDPPAFAKSKRDLDAALRGYKELNLRALKMLRPGGILVTCSCSYHISQSTFLEMLASAALDAHRTLRLIEVRGQSKDHPILLNVPETSYLKCVIASVSN